MAPLRSFSKLLFPVVCAVGFCLGVEAGSFQFVLLKISEEFGLSKAAMGSLVSIQFFAMLICPLIVGRLSDAVSKKKIAAIFVFIFAMGCLLCTFLDTLTGFIAGIFVVGGAFTTAQNATLAALADAYGTRAGKYLSICQCLYSLGAMSGPLFANFIIFKMDLGWRTVFYGCGMAFFTLFVFILLTKFETSNRSAAIETGGSSKFAFSGTLFLLMCSIMLYLAAENGFTYFLDTFFTSNLSAPAMSATALSLFWIGTAASRMLGSFFHARQRGLVCACFFGSTVLTAFVAISNSALLVVILSFCLGFIFGPIWPYLVGQATEEFPRYTGTVTSLMSISGSIGGTAVPIIVGATADAAGLRTSYLVLAVIGGVAAVVYLSYYRLYKKRRAL